MYESETACFTKKPPRTQLPTTDYGSEQIDSKCEQYDSGDSDSDVVSIDFAAYIYMSV